MFEAEFVDIFHKLLRQQLCFVDVSVNIVIMKYCRVSKIFQGIPTLMQIMTFKVY